MTDSYAYAHSTGKLKLKGVKDSKVDKKHPTTKNKKKEKSSTNTKPETETEVETEVDGIEVEVEVIDDQFEDNSVVLQNLEDEDGAIGGCDDITAKAKAKAKAQQGGGGGDDTKEAGIERETQRDDNNDLVPGRHKTDAEKRYDEQRRKRLHERLRREGIKTHKQRVEELNRYLSGLSEHHDMPRIGPG